MLSDVAALFHIKTVLQSVDYRQRPIDVADIFGNITVYHIALGELDLVESAFHQHLNEAVRRGVFIFGKGANLFVLLQSATGIHISCLLTCLFHLSAAHGMSQQRHPMPIPRAKILRAYRSVPLY